MFLSSFETVLKILNLELVLNIYTLIYILMFIQIIECNVCLQYKAVKQRSRAKHMFCCLLSNR